MKIFGQQAVNELAHWLKDVVGGNWPVHSSEESEAECLICQAEKRASQ